VFFFFEITAVGSALLGRFRIFRYDLRRWLAGNIPDLAYATGGPVRIGVPPNLGRAPGWSAGVLVARRDSRASTGYTTEVA